MTPDECVYFANSLNTLQAEANPVHGHTVENCVAACDANNMIIAGVGNNQCRACFTSLIGFHSSTDQNLPLKSVVIVIQATRKI